MSDTDTVQAVSGKDILKMCGNLHKAIASAVENQVVDKERPGVNPPAFAAVTIRMAFDGLAGSYGNKHAIEIIQKLVDALDKPRSKYMETIFEVVSIIPKDFK